MKKNALFLWPAAHFSFSSMYSFASVDEVEHAFREMYPGVTPVLFSSARASISAILELLLLGRADNVWCPPYSSHCVLETVSRVGTPSSSLGQSRTALVYHQWGYVHTVTGRLTIIEDSADSFLLPGQMLFPNDGNFQVVSLPKIYGCAGGGIAFCKDPADAANLKAIRDERKTSVWTQFLLKSAAGLSRAALQYWGGAEAGGGKPPYPVCADILKALKRTARLINDRKEKLEMMQALAPAWLQFANDRLPCVVPLEFETYASKTLAYDGQIISPRHFNAVQNADNIQLQKVLPVPIHQGITVKQLESLLKTLHE